MTILPYFVGKALAGGMPGFLLETYTPESAVTCPDHQMVWMWIGALVMVAGGLLSLSDRRLRVGTPRRSKVQDSGKEEAA